MYSTVEAVNKGQYFWNELRRAWPMPFSFEGTDSAVLMDDEAHLAIIVARLEEGESDGRLVVQLRDVEANVPVLVANLTSEYEFINGTCNGMLVDQVGSADALMSYAPLIKGQWIQQFPINASSEDEQHA